MIYAAFQFSDSQGSSLIHSIMMNGGKLASQQRAVILHECQTEIT